MKKRLMRVETNASTMFVSYDPEWKDLRVLDTWETQNNRTALEAVEDDSSWDLYQNIEDPEIWLGCNSFDPEAPKIVEEIQADI